MAKKKKLDKLSLDMIECEKAGYGCHYGARKAAQVAKQPVKKMDELPPGWRVCEWCGTPYKPTTKRPQKYCQAYCGNEAYREREKKRKAEKRGVDDG